MMTSRQIDFILHTCLIVLLLAFTLINQSTGRFLILVSQFFVGVFQVLSSIGRTFKYHSFDRTIQKMILVYWGLVAFYGIGWIVIGMIKADIEYIMPYLFSAWLIAFYYCYITYRIAFPKYIRSHLDI